MRMSRLSISIRPSDSSSCSTREKYSGVSDRREATVALLTGSATVIGAPGSALSSTSRSR